MILTIDLVPQSSWYNNVRSKVSNSEWNKIRQKVYNEYDFCCGICNAKGRLSAHEIWQFDDKELKQNLIGMIALCDLCHHVKHIGLAEVLAIQGKLHFQKIVNHYCKVNNCSPEVFLNNRNLAFQEWEQRSQKQWIVDVSALEKYTQD